MFGIDQQQVEHIARLARLHLQPAELARYQHDLASILTYMEQLERLDTSAVEPTAHPLPVHSVMREDQPRPSYGPEVALRNAPARDGSFFVVPKVLDQGDSG